MCVSDRPSSALCRTGDHAHTKAVKQADDFLVLQHLFAHLATQGPRCCTGRGVRHVYRFEVSGVMADLVRTEPGGQTLVEKLVVKMG